jgi:hypothetical protein
MATLGRYHCVRARFGSFRSCSFGFFQFGKQFPYAVASQLEVLNLGVSWITLLEKLRLLN